MIFLLITLLAWTILSMGMLGIDWGYTTLSKIRLQAAAQSLVLDSLSDQKRLRPNDMTVLSAMGINSSAVVERTFPHSSKAQVQISRNVGLPLKFLSIDDHIFRNSQALESILDSTEVERSATILNEGRGRRIASSALVELRPARQVGMAGSGQSSIPGAIPCVLDLTFWETLEENHSVSVTMNALGEILTEERTIGQFSQIVTYIGQEIHGPKPINKTSIHLDGYVPIFQRFEAHDRVVGFGHIQVSGTLPQVSITRQTTRIRSLNASTQLTGDISKLTEKELSRIFSINRSLQGAVLAPTLMS